MDGYATIDTRLLGLGRVWFGLVLLGDLLRRVPHLAALYTDEGLVPSHYHLFSPLFAPGFSLLHPFTTRAEVSVAFAGIGAIYLAYLVGLRTRLAQGLALLAYTSLNARNVFVENTGCAVLGLVLTWTLFLPLGRAYSLDAWLGRVPAGPRRHRSLAVTALLGQVVVLYAFNAIHKRGATWVSGEAVHWVLWQNRIATPVAGWLRAHEPAWLSPAMSWGAIGIEAAAPALLLSPWRQETLRSAHVALTWALHLGIALLCWLGPFPWVMLGLNLFMLPAGQVERLDRVVRRAAAGLAARAPRLADAAGRLRQAAGRPAPPWRPWPWLAAAREASVAVVAAVALIEVLRANPAVPPAWRPPRLAALAWMVDYPRLLQTWSLFAPDAPTTDGTVVVDATLSDGQHLDPFTGLPPALGPVLVGPWGLSQIWCDYFFHIRREELAPYRRHLGRYIERWRPAGDPSRSVVGYEVWWYEHRSPAPGSTTPTDPSRRLLLSKPAASGAAAPGRP